jgi:hypothetical protein
MHHHVVPDRTLNRSRQLALKEHDEKQLYVSRQHLFDIRNIYAILTDIIHKNIAKVSLNGITIYLNILIVLHRSACRRETMVSLYIEMSALPLFLAATS